MGGCVTLWAATVSKNRIEKEPGVSLFRIPSKPAVAAGSELSVVGCQRFVCAVNWPSLFSVQSELRCPRVSDPAHASLDLTVCKLNNPSVPHGGPSDPQQIPQGRGAAFQNKMTRGLSWWIPASASVWPEMPHWLIRHLNRDVHKSREKMSHPEAE